MNAIATHLADQLPTTATDRQAYDAWMNTRREAPTQLRQEVEAFAGILEALMSISAEFHTAKAEREAIGRAVLRAVREA